MFWLKVFFFLTTVFFYTFLAIISVVWMHVCVGSGVICVCVCWEGDKGFVAPFSVSHSGHAKKSFKKTALTTT